MKRLELSKGHIITSSTGQALTKIKCPDCEAVLMLSSKDTVCPMCAYSLPEIEKPKVTNLKANLEGADKAWLVCSSCKAVIHTDYPKSMEADLVMACYCPACGCSDIEVAEVGERTIPDMPIDTIDPESYYESAKKNRVGDDELTEGKVKKIKADGEGDVIDPDQRKDAGDDTVNADEDDENSDAGDGEGNEAPDTDEEISDETGEEVTSIDQMTAVLLDQPEPTWILFAKGEPWIRIRKSAQLESANAVFGTETFPQLFQQRAKESSIATAVKEFNAELYKKEEIISAMEAENVIFEKLQSSVLPKFIDCVHMAIQGMSKNIFPDLAYELKAAFHDELLSRGVEDAQSVIEASFEAAGTKTFEAIVAKAMELYNKTDEARSEIKSTVLASAVVKNDLSNPVSEKTELKKKLVDGNLNVDTMKGGEPIHIVGTSKDKIHSASINELREKLFRRR